MSRIIGIGLWLLIWHQTFAQKLPDNLSTLGQLKILTPWLQTNNAAGMVGVPGTYPAELNLGFDYETGNFKPHYVGTKSELYTVEAQSYTQLKKSILYGSFNYSKVLDRNTNFYNVAVPQIVYPYVLSDTIGSDTSDKEYFSLIGAIASPINEVMNWGVKVNYTVGVMAQNIDPRSKNNMLDLCVSPGLVFKLAKGKIGMHLNYELFNDDVDVSIVKANTQHTLFQLHGLGTSGYHEANSFLRRYNQQTMGGGIQSEIKNFNLSLLSALDVNYSSLNIDDGRYANAANWSAVKNDAILDGLKWNFFHVATIKSKESKHQITLNLGKRTQKGTEFIQRLEMVNEYGLERWITYAEEEKYYADYTRADVQYARIYLSENTGIQSMLKFGCSSVWSKENYHNPELWFDYQNFTVNASYLKSVWLKGRKVSIEAGGKINFNISENHLLPNNYIADKIIMPNVQYLTDSFYSGLVAMRYDFPKFMKQYNWFASADLIWINSEYSDHRFIASLKAGISF